MGSYAKCVVPYCGHVQRHRKECVYARFPIDIKRCRLWLRVVGVEDLVHLPLKKLTTIRYVCGCHFTDDQFTNATRKRLKGTAVPSLVDPRVVALSDQVVRNFPPRCNNDQTGELPTDEEDYFYWNNDQAESSPAILPECQTGDVSIQGTGEMEELRAGDFEQAGNSIVHDERIDASSVDKITDDKPAGWADICRLCAKTSDHIIPIFEDEGAQHNLSDKIHKYLPIQVTKTDTLPIQLCYHCAATILAWDELLEGCLDAQKQLAKILSDHTSREQDESKDIVEWDGEKEDPEVTTGVEATSVTIQKETDQPEDSKQRSDRAKETFRQFLDKRMYRGSKISNEIRSEAFEIKDENISRKNFATRETDMDHEFPDEKASEGSCETEKSLRLKCTPFCEDPNEPQDDPTNGKLYKCEECSKIFRLKDSLTRHQRIHRDERPFTCHVCGKQFRDSGGLSRHIKDVHAKLKKFTCDICCNSFSSKATRDDHRRTHTGERPYNCQNCEKSFKSRAGLYIHSKLHTDEFPYRCVQCEKKFRRRQEMLLHRTTHTGERNYSCDVCSRRFRVKTEVARHKLTHSDEKPYVCAECGLSFRQKRYLNNHVKSRHPRISND